MPKRTPSATLEEAYDEAVRMLARKARTAAEVAAALEARGAGSELVESVVARLKSQRHLDDAELASDEAFALVDGKGLAPSLALHKIVARGIAEAVAKESVEAAREGRTDAELCARALAKKTRGKQLDPALVAKEGRTLARLGYEEDLVARALEQALHAE